MYRTYKAVLVALPLLSSHNLIQALSIYRNGALELEEKLDLPENTPVQVPVTTMPTENPKEGSLFGAFPELAVIRDDDFAWAKRRWEHNLKKG